MTQAAGYRTCQDCGTEIADGLLACPSCGRLAHAGELRRLAAAAADAEASGDLTGALTSWRRAAELLPPGVRQGAQIAEKMRAISAAVDGRGPRVAGPSARAQGSKPGAGRGTLGAAVAAGAVALAKSKALLLLLLGNGKLLLLGLFKLPTLLSMLLYARLMGRWELGFGAGLVASIYVHEIGHVAALRRYGIDASPPMFIPGFGAFVRMKQYPTDAHEEARTGLAGPLWGLVAVGAAAAYGALAGSAVALGVASVAARINLFNLIPVWQLDGARGIKALSRVERWGLVAVAAATALVTRQWMPALVAVFAATRAMTPAGRGDAPPEGDRPMFALFVGLVVALAATSLLPSSVSW